MAKNQIDPKDDIDLINEQLHKTFTTSFYSEMPHQLFEDFLYQKYHLILKVWLNASSQYISGTTSVQVSMKPMRYSKTFP